MKEITNTDVFKPEIVDHDIIVPKKNYFNVYNNTIDEPFHKFYFYIGDAKLTNIYNENIYKFGLNNKNEKNKKLLEYMENLFSYIKSLFVNLYPEIIIELPWKEYDNYPNLINLFANDATIYIDANSKERPIDSINKEQTYSLLIELNYVQLITIESNNHLSHMLKFKLNLIVVQEKIIDHKTNLILSMSKFNSPVSRVEMYKTVEHSDPNIRTKHKVDLSPNKLPIMRLSLNPNELLSKKNALNKIGLKEMTKDVDVPDDKNIPEYMEKKNALKKVETDERTLLPILKKEYEDIQSNNSKSKTKHLTDLELEAELESKSK